MTLRHRSARRDTSPGPSSRVARALHGTPVRTAMARPIDRRSIHSPVLLAVAIAVAIALASAWTGYARGPLPRPGVDCEPPRCLVADRIANQCPCDGAVSHRSHVQCVSRVARDLVRSKALPSACKGAVVRCASRSTCGKPEAAACRRTVAGGGHRCRIRPSSARCEVAGGTAESGSCCRACPTTSTSSTSSTSSTTTSTTATTTTTLLPCGGIFPVCIGSCPAGEQCTAALPAFPCVCTPTGP